MTMFVEFDTFRSEEARERSPSANFQQKCLRTGGPDVALYADGRKESLKKPAFLFSLHSTVVPAPGTKKPPFVGGGQVPCEPG